MRRGTTPTVTLTVQGVALNEMKAILITFSQSEYLLEKKNGDKALTIEGNTIKVKLSQEETLQMSAGTLYAQLRALTESGDAIATEVAKLEVEDILSDGVIA